MKVHQQSAFVLLNRPYSESSWIVEVFTREYGRLALMAKGARRIKSKLKGVLLPFQPLLISWSGKGELPILTSAEINLDGFNLLDNELLAENLVCGFYCNELVVNLLHRHDPHPLLFDEYISCIIALSSSKNGETAKVLRDFEQIIVRESGYGISFDTEADGVTPIQDELMYRFQSNQGFVVCSNQNYNAVSGRIIRSLATSSVENIDIKKNFEPNNNSLNVSRNLGSDTVLTAQEVAQSKRLMREILRDNLGYKKIVSRELFFPRQRVANQ